MPKVTRPKRITSKPRSDLPPLPPLDCELCKQAGVARARKGEAADGGHEHPALTVLHLAAHLWAKAEQTLEATNFANAVILFASAINDAMAEPVEAAPAAKPRRRRPGRRGGR